MDNKSYLHGNGKDYYIHRWSYKKCHGWKTGDKGWTCKETASYTDTLYNVSKALDYDFALLYSIDKEQMNYDRENEAYKLSTAKILIELELKPDEIIKLNLRKKISELLR